MSSIVTKNGKRRVRADVMVNGERKTKYFPDASRESRRQAAAWESETRKQIVESQTRMECLTLGSWINDYLTDVQRRGMSQKTYDEKKAGFKRLVAFSSNGSYPFSPETPVDAVTKFQIKAHFDTMLDAGRSGNAVMKDRKNLAAAWTWGKNCIAEWPSGENPILAVATEHYPRIRNPRYVPPVEDMWKLLDWLETRALSQQPAHVQDYAMIMVALHLAARRGEIFRIKTDDLDFSRDQVRLWTRKRKGGAMECDWLPMTKELRSVLLRWLEIRMALPGIVADTIFVCVDETAFCEEHYGKPFTARSHAMKRWCGAVSIEPFGWHGIRHLTASTIFNKGYPTAHIQAILRHQSPHTTDLYLRRLGLRHVKTALEEGLKRGAEVISFPEKKQVVSK